MGSWRSPLLYFGIVVIVIAAAALAIPPFVDWTHFRSDIENYGRRFTGRDVRVNGLIEVKLFPWPRVVLQDVQVANPPGAQTPDLLRAGRIEGVLSLAPLISGQIAIEQINVEKPVFGLERLASGGATWKLSPKLELSDYVDASHIAVAGITITQATVLIGDGRRGGLAQLDDVNAEVSAPSLDGPWRLRGTASYQGQPIEVSLSTGKHIATQPLKMAMRVAPLKASGISYSFDGEVGGDRADAISGNLKMTPVQADRGQGDAEVDIKPLVLVAQVKVQDDTISLDKIEVYPARALDAANLLTGKATVQLGSAIVVDADMTAAKLDIDAVTGERGRALLYSPSSLEIMTAAQQLLPENVTANLKLAINNLVVAGSSLDGTRLEATLSRRQLAIKRLEALLPGQTRFGFAGIFFNGDAGPQLVGDISIDSLAVRDLVTWAAPDKAREISAVWSGARGRLTGKAKADIVATAIRLTDIDAKLDDAHFNGSLQLAGGPTPSVAVRLDAERIDIDRYAPDGLSLDPEDSDPVLASVDLIARTMGLGDFRMTANAKRLRLNGVEAEDVAIDMGANEDGIEFRTVDFGNVAGARFDMTGLLHFPEEAVAGSINAKITAGNPGGLFRLLGLSGRGEGNTIYDRLAALQPLNIEVVAEATADGDNTDASLKLEGVLGRTTMKLSGGFKGNAGHWQDGDLHFSGEAHNPSSAAVLSLLGLESAATADAAADLTVASTGTYERGLATTLEATAYGARTQFVGSVAQGAAGPRLSGRLAVLAERAELVYRAMGVPTGELSPMAQVLSGEGGVKAEAGKVNLDDINGTIAGVSYSGKVDADLDGDRPKVDVRLDLGRLSAPWLLDVLVLPHDGEAHDITTRLPDRLDIPAAIEASLAVDALELMPGLTLTAAKLELKASADKTSIEASGRGSGGDDLRLALAIEPASSGAKMAGEIAGLVPLGTLFQLADGTRVLEGKADVSLKFAGEGRSAQGLVAATTASGSYRLQAGTLAKVSPAAFAAAIETTTRPEEVDALIRDTLTSGDMTFTGGTGTLSLEKGVLNASPLGISGKAAKGELKMLFEPTEGAVDLAVRLELERPAGVPAFEIAYAGSPWALERTSDTQALKNYMVVKVLNESIKQLEELQRREREMQEEEEQFRLQQEALDATRKELSRKADQLKAWERLRPLDEGAELLPDAPAIQNPAESELVPTPKPKQKPPVPVDAGPVVAEPIVITPAPASRPEPWLFQIPGDNLLPPPEPRIGRTPAAER